MPETPDFEQIARRIFPVEDAGQDPVGAELSAESRDHIVAQLRLVWKARGAADIARLDTELSTLMGPTAAGPYVKNLDRALRKLDR